MPEHREKAKILICTANMGNQRPDVESLAAWIPKDGEVEEVLVDNPKYPIRKHLTSGANKFKMAVSAFIERKYQVENPMDKFQQLASSAATATQANTTTNIRGAREKERFDIIVVGMQESTWHHKDNSRDGGNHASSEFEEIFEQHVNSSDIRTGPTKIMRKSVHLARAPIKAAKAVKTLTLTDKDHTKRNKRKLTKDERNHMNKQNANAEEEQEQPKSPLSEESTRTQARRDTSALHEMLRERLPSYTHEISYQRGEMRLMLFYLDFQCDVQVLSVKAQNTGRAGLANKGGIVAEVLVNSGTRLAFMTAHLEAHEGEAKYDARCASVYDILRGTSSSTTACRCDASQSSHYTFAFGDLNFRTRLPGYVPGSPEHIEATNALVAKKDWETLNRRDELYMALRQKDCFVGFQTPLCWFPPTFKVTRGEGYEYNAKRSPSYTDRILYRASDQLGDNIKVLAYEPIDNFASSDHKPIRAVFDIHLNESLKWKPSLGERAAQMRRMVKQHARSFCVVINNGNIIVGRKKHHSKRLLSDASRENLHLFVSSISCTIETTKDDYRPSPYVCFMSTPAEAIQKDKSKMDTLRKALKINGRKQTKGDDGRITRSDAGFPRTRCIRNSNFPQWRDEEVHFKVKSHNRAENPIDLTGSMVHIAVCDAKANSRLIGSFTLNLAHVIKQTRTKNDAAPKTPTLNKSKMAMKFKALIQSLRSQPEDVPKGSGHSSLIPTSSEPSSPRAPRKLLSLGSSTTGSSRTPSRILRMGSTRSLKQTLEPDCLEETSESAHYSYKPDRLEGISESATCKSDIQEGHLEIAISKSGVTDEEEGNDPFNVSRVATNGPSDALRRAMKAPVSLSTARNQARAALLKRAQSTRSVMSSRMEAKHEIDDLNIQSLTISEPLLKNGKNVGMIVCTIDSFWINDKEAEYERSRREGNETVETNTSSFRGQ